MNWQLLSVDDVAPEPWRNGGGATRALLAWPHADPWSLRISVADIERDGPFSVYPGVDRWFTVLTGGGVTLRFNDGESWRVAPDDALLQFDGERAPHCTLNGGPSRDLNVMVARERGSATCEPVRSGSVRIARPALTAVFAADATRLSSVDAPDVDMKPMSLAWCIPTEEAEWLAVTHGRAWWIAYSAWSGG